MQYGSTTRLDEGGGSPHGSGMQYGSNTPFTAFDYCCRDSSGVLRPCEQSLWWHVDTSHDDIPVSNFSSTPGTTKVEYFNYLDSDKSGDISFQEFHAEFFDFSSPNWTFEFWAGFDWDHARCAASSSGALDYTTIMRTSVSREMFAEFYACAGFQQFPTPRYTYQGNVETLFDIKDSSYAEALVTITQTSPGWAQQSLWNGIPRTSALQYVFEWPTLEIPEGSGGGANCEFEAAGQVILTASEEGATIWYSLRILQSSDGFSDEALQPDGGVPIEWDDSCAGICTYIIKAFASKEGWNNSPTS